MCEGHTRFTAGIGLLLAVAAVGVICGCFPKRLSPECQAVVDACLRDCPSDTLEDIPAVGESHDQLSACDEICQSRCRE